MSEERQKEEELPESRKREPLAAREKRKELLQIEFEERLNGILKHISEQGGKVRPFRSYLRKEAPGLVMGGLAAAYLSCLMHQPPYCGWGIAIISGGLMGWFLGWALGKVVQCFFRHHVIASPETRRFLRRNRRYVRRLKARAWQLDRAAVVMNRGDNPLRWHNPDAYESAFQQLQRSMDELQRECDDFLIKLNATAEPDRKALLDRERRERLRELEGVIAALGEPSDQVTRDLSPHVALLQLQAAEKREA